MIVGITGSPRKTAGCLPPGVRIVLPRDQGETRCFWLVRLAKRFCRCHQIGNARRWGGRLPGSGKAGTGRIADRGRRRRAAVRARPAKTPTPRHSGLDPESSSSIKFFEAARPLPRSSPASGEGEILRRFAPEVYDSGFRVKPGMTRIFFASPGVGFGIARRIPLFLFCGALRRRGGGANDYSPLHPRRASCHRPANPTPGALQKNLLPFLRALRG
jgi:hypothetical protein